MSIRIIIGVLLSISSAVVMANFLPKTAAIPGGIVQIPVHSPTATQPLVFFDKHQVTVLPTKKKDHWLAIVGIPLTNNINKQYLELRAPTTEKIEFKIKNKVYRKQNIKIRKRKYNKLSAATKEQITEDSKQKTKALKTWSQADPFRKKFQAPVHGYITSQFGLRRYYNGVLSKPHTGLDIASPMGTEIKNPAPGVVIATQNWFFSGNTVLIDHGQGLLTMYAHLKEFQVKPGQHLAQGKTIGLVGKTGRVTGAHLHWSVFLTGTWVNPLLFVSARQIKRK